MCSLYSHAQLFGSHSAWSTLVTCPDPTLVEKDLVTIRHRTRSQRGVTNYHFRCDHALTYYQCHVGPHSGAYYSNCAVSGHFTCQMATSHWVWRDVIVTRPFSSLGGWGLGTRLGQCKQLQKVGGRGLARPRTNMQHFFWGPLYWQVSHDNILAVLPFDFAKPANAISYYYHRER